DEVDEDAGPFAGARVLVIVGRGLGIANLEHALALHFREHAFLLLRVGREGGDEKRGRRQGGSDQKLAGHCDSPLVGQAAELLAVMSRGLRGSNCLAKWSGMVPSCVRPEAAEIFHQATSASCTMMHSRLRLTLSPSGEWHAAICATDSGRPAVRQI